jgi:nucleoid-associated protein YgaU
MQTGPWRYDRREKAMKTREIIIYPPTEQQIERRTSEVGTILFIFLFMVAAAAGFYVCQRQDNQETSTYVVHTGDTLWSISKEYTGNEDIRSLYSRIMKDNNLDNNGTLTPGMKLKIRHMT